MTPSARSTLTVNAVPCDSVFSSGRTIGVRSRSWHRSGVRPTQMTPEVYRTKNAIASGVAASAAMIRSPFVLAVLVIGDHDDLSVGRSPRWLLRSGRTCCSSEWLLIRWGRRAGRYADISRSTYLAITSTSRFTRSPGRLAPSVVTSAVWGMIATVKPSSSGCTIVRLTPSTVTDPFSTRYRNNG